MNARKLIAAALAAAAAAVSSQPAAAYTLKPTGRTLASPTLVVDVLRTIQRYSKANGGCSFLFSARMEVMPRGYRPMAPSVPAEARGGHFEQWTVNACAAKQRFQIAMWPSPRGGTDFAVTPMTGRLPLHALR